MGEQNVKLASNQRQTQIFVKHLLQDVKALGRMLEEGWFDDKITRIGAEQELCIIDKNYRPAMLNTEILEKANNPNFTTELAKFNAEINLVPIEFKDKCLSEMEEQLTLLIAEFRKAATEFNSEVILTGILPTIRKFDLSMENLTPMQRYFAICKSINKLRGNVYELRIRGIDELIMKHDSPLLEACNTGFQVHLQVNASDFVQMYNISQALAAPVLAASVNSPMLLGKRLWKETRIALFQQSIDTRTTSDHLREFSPRVTFGNGWVKNSILELYREDIVRYRVLLSSELTEDVMHKIEQGEVPQLKALSVHNSTIYRWNRPCYGISDGKAHLRIENRILPAGPTTLDEMANATFWLGLMNGYKHKLDDVTKLMDFDIAKSNFTNASQHGLDTNLTWFENKKVNAAKLILDELLPIAEEGLKKVKINEEDIQKYLGVIDKRVGSGNTGAQWMLNAYTKLSKETTPDDVLATITASIVKNQKENKPVHEWDQPDLKDNLELDHTLLLVEECMTRDLFTVQPDDIISLVAEIMDWQKLRYVPVENGKGKLVGLVTARLLLRHYCDSFDDKKPIAVKKIMIKEPVTINPEATIMEAMELMQKHGTGCLPVVKSQRLIGIISEQNFLNITKRLLNRFASN